MTVLESHWILEDSEFGLSEEQFLWAELTDMLGGKKLQCFLHPELWGIYILVHQAKCI
jgi:hypothetical protein